MSPLLRVDDLHVTFSGEQGATPAVRGVSLKVDPGEVVAMVGESGSGKSATALAVMGLLPGSATATAHRVEVDGSQLALDNRRATRRLRGGTMAMVFQDPLTALNPHLTVGEQVLESVRLHQGLRGRQGRDRVVALLAEAGIPQPERRALAWPHQLSGGLRQRALIAMALAGDPKLLIADEPTTALNVTVQLQILELFRQLCRERGTGLLLITHDLGVVATVADRVAVMYAGRVVEEAAVTALFDHPRHPYTRGLLASLPRDLSVEDRLPQIPGAPPDPRALPAGCPFVPRCADAVERCTAEEPQLRDGSACWLTEDQT